MKTSPAFQFYPADFLLGTVRMTDAQVGAYIRLLCFQWNDDGLPNDPKILSQLAQTEQSNIEAILDKFPAGRGGKLRNPKLESVRKSLNAFRKSRQDNGKKGGRPKNLVVSRRLATDNLDKSSQSPIHSPSQSHSPLAPQEREKLLSDILRAYPRTDSPNQCRESIEAAIDSGEDPRLMLQLVRECAAHCNAAPGGASNRFVPKANSFFQQQQWREPEVFAERWADSKPNTGSTEMTLR